MTFPIKNGRWPAPTPKIRHIICPISPTGETLDELKAEVADPAAYLLVHCGGRRAGIGDRIGEVAELLADEADGVPFLTEFTFGEYGQVDDGANTCGGLMLSFTGFSK